MFGISSDILNIILAASMAALTTVLVIFFIYLISILRRINKLIKEIAGLGKMLSSMREKLEHSASHLGLIAEAVKHIVTHYVDVKAEEKKRRKK